MFVQDIKGIKAVPEYRKLHDIVIEYMSLRGGKAMKTLGVRGVGELCRGWGGDA
jgi:hypothetical protein